MQDVEIKIPPEGVEKHIDVQGSAFRVVRMSFNGYEDPAGNPRIAPKSRGGSVLAVVGDPVRVGFRGLYVTGTAESAGSVMVLRVYEDAERAGEGRKRRQLTRKAPADFSSFEIAPQTLTLDENTLSDSVSLVSDAFDNLRVVGLSTRVFDDSLSKGYSEVKVGLSYEGKVVKGSTFTVNVGADFLTDDAEGLLLPVGYDLDLTVEHKGDGSGAFKVTTQGLAVYDQSAPTPPE